MLHFCTLYNINYLNKGLLMYQSLTKYCNNFKMYVLCLDDKVYDYWRAQNENGTVNNVVPLALSDVEKNMPELLTAKSNRSVIEYYFTLSPCMPLYILNTFPEVDVITSLDADIYFFSSPEIIYDDLKDYSVLITPHRLTEALKASEVHGRYNVSFQVFKRDDVGLAVLNDWKDKCIEWCYDRLEDGKYADQKYLDTWIRDFKKVKEITHPGAGLAPWNIGDVKVKKDGDNLFVSGQPVIYYHFHALRFLRPNVVSCGTGKYKAPINRNIYIPYIKALLKLNENKKSGAEQTNRDVVKTKWNDIRMNRDLFFIVGGKYFLHPWITPNF